MTHYDVGLSKRFFLRVIIILIAPLLLFGCNSPPYQAPIENARHIPSYKTQYHRVVKGDTVYSIAWRYGLDYRKLARANNLSKNYAIWPGQLLNLDVSHLPKILSQPSVKTLTKTKAKPISKGKSSLTRAVKLPVAVTAVPGSAAASVPKPSKTKRSKKQPAKEMKRTVTKKKSGSIQWQWPLKGAILVKFDQKQGLNKGIDIASKLGESVTAAARGQVVYAGSGLRGYGKLVIVKHSEKFLSAYAHNRRLLVKEGQQVAAGNKIAEVGAAGSSDTPQLHFEIRYDGVPVNPIKYLP